MSEKDTETVTNGPSVLDKSPLTNVPVTTERWNLLLPAGASRLMDVRSPELLEAADHLYTAADTHAQIAVLTYMNAGVFLNEVRTRYPGDKEFGQACEKLTPNISRTWRSRLMQVAAQFWRDDRALKLPVSTLAELASAEDKIREEVLNWADDPEKKKPTRKDVRDEKKRNEKEINPADAPAHQKKPEKLPPAEVDHESAEAEEKARTKQKSKPRPPGPNTAAIEPTPTVNIEKMTIQFIGMPLEKRLDYVKKNGMVNTIDVWMIFGLSPNPDFLPNKETIEVLNTGYHTLLDLDDSKVGMDRRATLHKVYKELLDEYI